MHEVQKYYDARNNNSTIINLQKLFLPNYSQAFLFINYLLSTLKISNMRFMNLIRFYDFIQVLGIKRIY
jgi:hypothetical protein